MNIRYTSEMVEIERQRYVAVADAIDACYEDGVTIYGAGFLGTWASHYFKSRGVKINKFIDRDLQKIGSQINGIPVVEPKPDNLTGISAMLIAARHAVREVERDMAEYRFITLSFDGYFVLRNYDRLLAIRDQYLSDYRSVEVFNALLIVMLTGDIAPCRDVMEKDMYFCLPEFCGNFEEIFVDAGAFVGDTVERFIWENLGTFRHIYAFEPGYKQFNALQHRLRRLIVEWAINPENVSLIRAGLADKSGAMSCTFVNDAPLRHGLADLKSDLSDDDTDRVNVLALDEFLSGRKVTFIKADVEGMEMELLRGSERTIRNYRPKMALCVYHYPSHLYEVAEYVRYLVPEYKFVLRQHVPLFGDFVLYCYI
jgi:FkbM family methyltransferase